MGRVSRALGGAFIYVMASADTIDVGGLLAGKRQHLVLDQQVRVEPFEGVTFPEPARVHLELQGVGDFLEIAGTVDTALSGECVRCLGEVGRTLHLDVDEQFEPGSTRDPFGEGNVLAGDRLDVAYLTTQLVCSAIPIGLLCQEDCKGICPRCGENKNTGSCRCAGEGQNGEP